MSYILDVSKALKACILIQNGCPVNSDDIALYTYDEIVEIIQSVATGVNTQLTNNEAPFSFNVTTQTGNIPKNSTFSYNSSTHVLSFTKGDGTPTQNYTLTFDGSDIVTTSEFIIGGDTFEIGTSIEDVLTALVDVIGINNVNSVQSVNALFNNSLPLSGVTLPSSPIEKDTLIVHFKDGIASYYYNGSGWSLIGFKGILIVKDTAYNTFSAATSGGVNIGEYFLASATNLEGWIPNTLIKRTV